MSYTKVWTDKVQFQNSYQLSSQNGPGPNGTTLLPLVSLDQSRTGAANVDWRKRMDSGEIVASPFTTERRRFLLLEGCNLSGYAYHPYSSSWARQAVQGFGSNPRPATHIVDASAETVVRNRALNKILEKIRFQQEHISVLPAIGELRQTMRQLGAPFSSIVKLTNGHLDKLQFTRNGLGTPRWYSRSEKYLRVIRDTYLEYVFGLQPLMADTRGIAEALGRWKAEAEYELPRPTTLAFTQKATDRWSTIYHDPTTKIINSASFFPGKEVVQRVTDYGVVERVWLGHSLQAPFGSLERLEQLMGWDPREFVPTLWELVPWSWLIDYFVNVQEILEAGFTVTSHVKKRVRTERKVTEERVIVNVAPTAPGYQFFEFTGKPMLGRWQSQITTLSRTIDEPLGVPELSVSFPNSVKKLANMAAALTFRR